MAEQSAEQLLLKIKELENRLAESEQMIEAIKAGEVDAFAINSGNNSEVYTLQSGDYAYRILIEEFGEGAVNVTEEGLIVYTNNCFCELLQLPYEKVAGAFIYDFIHAGSKEQFDALFREALNGKTKGEINLEVNGKIIPVYISLTSLQPKLATVGIIFTDLTEKKKHEEIIIQYQKDLESKNVELVRTNAELASFSFVASHDLQEPLRKIQGFSNRILDKEYENFSPVIKDYFNRITNASKRMQNLITSLLNYSRTNTAEIIFVPTDLNVILEEVKHNLSELFEEHHAVLEASSLPVLNVIPYQFSQLLSNIFTNSIKYKKENVSPVITINACLVKASELKIEATSLYPEYWKIMIADNGIGFEQQYTEKIFELFQRLHGRFEYEGTGIGLAICKKIVQNHHGFINAWAQPGVGSVFNIYIPANN
jgi:PAS domain S-box-containing protein